MNRHDPEPGTYADTDRRGRHDGVSVDDSAASDGAAFKLRDELADREAYRALRSGVTMLDRPWWARTEPRLGRHRANA